MQQERSAMTESSAAVCAVCFRILQDPRLLRCLHSYCKACLDDLSALTAPGNASAQAISCPLCQSQTHLTQSGVSGLPRDKTVREEPMRECHTCKEAGEVGEAELWCTTCDAGFCKDHGVPHVLANSGHKIKGFAEASCGQAAGSSSAPSRHCQDHDRPLEYFCKQCDEAVCGDCVILGGHRQHNPVVTCKDIVKELKTRVRRKTDALKTERLLRVEKALSAVAEVSTRLSSRADKARTNIRAARKSVIDAVELIFAQRLADVDDLEDSRLKRLGAQRDELQALSNSLKGAIGFSRKVLENDVQLSDAFDLLLIVDKRADELEEVRITEEPVEHACLYFEKVNEDELLVKVRELIGVLLPDRRSACAMHSVVEGQTTGMICIERSPTSLIVVAKDSDGHSLGMGGDIVRAEVHDTKQKVGPTSSTNVTDKDDGTYVISFTIQQQGNYLLDVFINDEKLCVSVSCEPGVCFDPGECQAGATVSEDKLAVTHTGRDGDHSSVLSSRAMKSGLHVWQVNVRKSKRMYIYLGVAEKAGLTANANNYTSTYSWYGRQGKKCILGEMSKCMADWQQNDVLQLRLNCAEHTLSIRNTRSGEEDTINDLPATELFAYFRMSSRGDSLRLV